MEQRFSAMAARAVRMIAAFDYRTPDAFEQTAFATIMSRHPRIEWEDYEEGIAAYHEQAGARKMRAGDLLGVAKRAWEKRTDARSLPADDLVGDEVPRPANYKQMLAGMRQLVREFKDQGIVNPSNEDLVAEYNRRVKENNK